MYNPSDHFTLNISFGVTDLPLNAKSLFYDTALDKYRPFISTSECSGYFAAEFKDPTFECIINTGGTLNNDATITGGQNNAYWFRDGINLEKKGGGYSIEQVDAFIAALTQAITDHVNDLTNPHEVTKGQVGLGNVDNTPDTDKPASNPQKDLFPTKQDLSDGLANKVDKVTGKDLSTNDYDNTEKAQVATNKTDITTIKDVNGLTSATIVPALLMTVYNTSNARFKMTIQEFINYVTPIISGLGSSGLVLVTGTVLPASNGTPHYTVVPAGTYTRSGMTSIVTTERINILFDNGTVWTLGFAIPVLDGVQVIAAPAGTVLPNPVSTKSAMMIVSGPITYTQTTGGTVTTVEKLNQLIWTSNGITGSWVLALAINISVSASFQTIVDRISIDDDGLFRLYDDNGNMCMTIDAAGLARMGNLFSKVLGSTTFTAPQINATGNIDITDAAISTESKYAMVFYDNNGNIGGGFNLDGSLIGGTSAAKRIFGMLSDVNHFIVYGQSLSIGAVSGGPITTTTEPGIYTFNKGPIMINYDADATKYNSLALEVEVTDETPSGAMARMIKQSLISSGKSVEGYDILVSNPGEGGKLITELNKGTANYQRMIDGVTNGKALANASNKTYNVPAIFWLQGEANHATDKATYTAALKQLQADANTDIKAITGQSNEVVFLNYQMNSIVGTETTGVPAALMDICDNSTKFYRGPILYAVPHASGGLNIHLDKVGYQQVGAMAGEILKQLIVDGVEWTGLHLKSYNILNNFVNLLFYVPVQPLVLDTVNVNNPGNYGFRMFNASGVEQTITSVSITRGDRVKIVCAVPITTGFYITYATNNGTTGSFGPVAGQRGCLRDSQGATKIYKPGTVNYAVNNWCEMFTKSL